MRANFVCELMGRSLAKRPPRMIDRNDSLAAGLATSRTPVKKIGRPLTPKRPAFAFLVTPKLPLSGRSVKLDVADKATLIPFSQSHGFKFYHFFSKSFNKGCLNPITVSTSPAFFVWKPAAWLRITGSDALSFLQGQFTNDLRQVASGAVYGLWLTLKGKVLGDGFVLAGAEPEEFWIGSYTTPAAVLRERLESFIIADDVTVEDQTADWGAVSIFGSVPLERLGRSGGAEFIFPGRRSQLANVEWVFRGDVEGEVRRALQDLPELDLDAVETIRISAGIPAVPADIGPNDLPNEAGLEDEAISFTKGCYLGQEVMARLKSMGQVRRRLLRVRGKGPRPMPGAALYGGERKVGELRSVVADGTDEYVGLAMVSLINLAGHSDLALSPQALPTVTILDPR